MRKVVLVENIVVEEVVEKMKLVGMFKLRYDVIKGRVGFFVKKYFGGKWVEDLLFRVVLLDLFIEGVGYIEVVV